MFSFNRVWYGKQSQLLYSSYFSVVGGKINLDSGTSAAFKKSASFNIHYGLGGGGGMSFESISMPGYYITSSKYRVVVQKMVNSASWKSLAEWRPVRVEIHEHTETHYIQGPTVTHTQYVQGPTITHTVTTTHTLG